MSGNERRLWEAATETCPGNFVSHVLLGNVYEKAGERDKALASFRTSLKYNDAYLIAHLNIGRILRDRKQHAAAMKSFKSATLSCDTGQTCGIVSLGRRDSASSIAIVGIPKELKRFGSQS